VKRIELYKMVMGGEIWNFTSADKVQFFDSGDGLEAYTPIAISRGKIEQRPELSKLNLPVKIPIGHSLSVLLMTSFVEQIMLLTVFSDTEGDSHVEWKGRLAGLNPGVADLTLNFEQIFTTMRRPGLRARFQKSCRFALYGRGCEMNPADFDVAATLNAIAGRVLTIPEADTADDGRYTGGMVAAPDGTYSFVINHVGSLITVQRVSYSMAQAFDASGPGLAITIYPGCQHTREDCNAFFNNLPRYGGFDWIPEKNPMGGLSIV